MQCDQISDLLKTGENHMLECKLAEKGLPESIWETYSAFANTEGGTILLGVKEQAGMFMVQGLPDDVLARYQKDFWNTLNNRKKISKNILLNHHVFVAEISGKRVLRIDVPAADRRDKPVYVGADPMQGTYRRNFEGDYLCREEAVRGMFADQQDIPDDIRVAEDLGLDAFNKDTIKGYRIRFESLNPVHPWNRLPNDEFLMKLTAVKKNKEGKLSPTVAGLLMFGNADSIIQVFPGYFLDYREESDERNVRWLFRLTSDDGDWSGNLYDFFYKVVNRIDDDIAVPFINRIGEERAGKLAVHEALHEVVANALIHANYYGRQGIVIRKHRKKITVSNPGILRITKEELLAGGNSDPRNPILFKLFYRVNIGERAGSGVDRILSAWREQEWKEPVFEVSYQPERVTVELEVGQVTHIPVLAESRVVYQTKSRQPEALPKEQLILNYIKTHGSISIKEVLELCGYQSKTSGQKLVRCMTEAGQIERVGSGKLTRYVLRKGTC